jgi:hypothetical protein
MAMGTGAARKLLNEGFVVLTSHRRGWEDVKRNSLRIIAEAAHCDPLGHELPELKPVGEYSVPPPGAPPREYQALHIDFGLPINSERPIDVARFTVLQVDSGRPSSEAVTRIVSLGALFRQRTWPTLEVLTERLRRSAVSDKAVEGILGRIVEAFCEGTTLPPVSLPGFLCGLEFSSYEDEDSYFRSHGMDVVKAERRIVLRPGEVLLIDNLRTAHGRLGVRRESELHQLFVGYQALAPDLQTVLLDRVLAEAI